MARADYGHWNEEQDQVWWQEEGKHSIHVDHYDDPDQDNYDSEWKEGEDDDTTDDEETSTDHSSSG